MSKITINTFYFCYFYSFLRKMKRNLRQDMKIPKPRKRGHAFRIELMFNGQRISATRDTEKECEQCNA
ncbi:hypothetical protein [Acinetobacter sp. ANC 4558]|uniref:hypothetical protein n=1 Tax=Acinetobacter sp. ANC 4558 TaxID=1977876 RepID=UPI001D173ED4|nr:hypothetical protein [Acinetobacter sp. ANC 4558]